MDTSAVPGVDAVDERRRDPLEQWRAAGVGAPAHRERHPEAPRVDAPRAAPAPPPPPPPRDPGREPGGDALQARLTERYAEVLAQLRAAAARGDSHALATASALLGQLAAVATAHGVDLAAAVPGRSWWA